MPSRSRARMLRDLEFLGIRLDPTRSRAVVSTATTRIDADDSAVPVWVVPADEEWQTAREVVGRLEAQGD